MAAISKACGLAALMGEPIASGMRIGLLGGSFNPAHEGHRHISLDALKRIGLDQVWWLVSPQNPLKPSSDMAPFAERLASAKAMANHPALRVTDLESKLGTQFTVDTVNALDALGGDVNFVWLMGADNFLQLPAWRDWEKIMRTLPVAVLARPGFGRSTPLGKAAQRFGRHRVGAESARLLPFMAAPAWVFLPIPLHPASSTALRALRASRAGGKTA